MEEKDNDEPRRPNNPLRHLDLFSGIGGFAIYEDVRTINEKELGKIDIITGGFPCQPWSLAGSRKGADDDRDLWPEMVAIIENLQPKWVIGENVRGFVNEPLGLQRTLSDLESIGYQAIPHIIPASGVGAFHRRERVWIIANPRGDGKPIVRKESREVKQPEQISLF